jgi:hypothetical protein
VEDRIPALGSDAATTQSSHHLKIVSHRIEHANMAYTLAIYTHPSTGKDRDAAGKVAGMLGWACARCGAAYFGTPPEDGLCEVCK